MQELACGQHQSIKGQTLNIAAVLDRAFSMGFRLVQVFCELTTTGLSRSKTRCTATAAFKCSELGETLVTLVALEPLLEVTKVHLRMTRGSNGTNCSHS